MRSFAVLCFLFTLLAPSLLFADSGTVTGDGGMTITSDDERYSLELAGRFQLRYQFLYSDIQSDHSTFSLRRLQPDIQGHAYDPNLRFRLMFDISGGASLRDGWVSYRFGDTLTVRVGQFNIPFSWERHAPPTRHQFVERSAANNEFQWPTGRDIGVMAHGDLGGKFRYAVGFFSGQGANAAPPGSMGHMASTRLIFTPLGTYQTSEVPVVPAEELNLSIGLGTYGTVDNEMQDWQPMAPERELAADYVMAATADLHLRVNIVSLHVAGFFRVIKPEQIVQLDDILTDSLSEPRNGFGATAHLAVLAIPERLVAVARYSDSRPYTDFETGQLRQAMAGVQILHLGHQSKVHAEGGLQWLRLSPNNWQAEGLVRLQYQFLF